MSNVSVGLNKFTSTILMATARNIAVKNNDAKINLLLILVKNIFFLLTFFSE